MQQSFDVARFLKLRKLTRAIAEHLSKHLREQLSALAPLFNAKIVFGDFIRSDVKQTVRGADQAFEELQGLYQSVARTKPFNLQEELKPPLDVFGSSVEIGAAEYAYVAKGAGEEQNVTVTSPFKWVLSYKDLGAKRLRELLVSQSGSARADLQVCVLHYLVLHAITSKRPGVGTVLEALRFPVSSLQYPEFGSLPVTCISSPIATMLPPDDVIIQSVELSGTAAFEEVVNLESISHHSDPLRSQLIELVESHGENLLSEVRPSG